MVSDDKVFDKMVASEPEVDYTGGKADEYIEQYTDRPEDAGTLEGLHATLSGIGIVNPIADLANMSLYVMEGDWAMAGVSGLAALSVVPTAFTSSKKIIAKSLTEGTDNFSKYNQKLNEIGETASYVNKKIINEGGVDVAISHSNKTIVERGRAAVVVKVENLKTGKITYQPFYRSTGTGHSAKSVYNWLPFEGMMTSSGSSVSVRVTNTKNKIYKSADERLPGWRGTGPDGVLERIPGTDRGVRFKKDITQPGWLVKAFKNFQDELVDSNAAGKIKRGLPLHEKIDHHLRNNLNFDVISKNLHNYIPDKIYDLGLKTTKTSSKNWDEMSIQEKIKAISEDPDRSKNFLKRADETIQGNIRRSKRGTKGD